MNEEKKPRVNPIFSKVRITPKKAMSIPRLELIALLIGLRSLKFVSKKMGLKSTQRISWIDSQCVLNWLKKQNTFICICEESNCKNYKQEEC